MASAKHGKSITFWTMIATMVVVGQARVVSVLRSSPWKHTVVEGYRSDAVLRANFTNTMNETGWSIIEIHGLKTVPDDEMAYLAGYTEGALTGELIHMMYVNSFGDGFCVEETSICDKLVTFVSSNQQYMKEQIAKQPDSDYWRQVYLYLKQLEGLRDGYYSNTDLPQLPNNSFWYLQINNDLSDLQAGLGKDRAGHSMLGDGKCSALVKLLPNNADLYTSHDTWAEYQSMLRMYKLYDLPYHSTQGGVIPGSRISMSSYPGKLQSEDDYYIINSKLVTMETTNDNSNSSLWTNLSPSTVFEPVRVMVANRLATSGESWSETFARDNSGTYNNQWMIVDYKLFQPNAPLPNKDVLWVLEQLPGYVVYHDQTQVLKAQTYWPSYNIPYYGFIFNISGYPGSVEKYGSWFSYEGAPRAQIFKRDHSKVKNIQSMIELMRYNDFKNDPLSRCKCTPPYSGENAISARSDLNPSSGTYPFSALGHRCHGGIDNKVTSYEMVKELSSIATAGPTHRQQPVFKWSTSGFERPLGHPDAFDYAPIHITWDNN